MVHRFCSVVAVDLVLLQQCYDPNSHGVGKWTGNKSSRKVMKPEIHYPPLYSVAEEAIHKGNHELL